MACYGYIRVSTLGQAGRGESLDVQTRRLEGWAMMQGRKLDAIFEEKGVSGAVAIKDRTAGAKLWERVRPGDTIVAAKLDRIFRSSLEALNVVEELMASQIGLVLLDLGGDVASNSLSTIFLTIASAFAEAERDRIRERVSQTKAEQRQRGRYLGGHIPYGFERTASGELKPVDAEQAVIRFARRLHLQGRSLRFIQAKVQVKASRRLSLDALSRIVRGDKG